MLEEYGPKIIYNKGIHNTIADAVLWLAYDPSVNQTAESFYTMKVRNSKSRQRHNWMTVLKNWGNLDTDTDKLDLKTNKHDDWNLVFAHHKEEEEIYRLTTIKIAETQHKDQELKIYFKKNGKMLQKDLCFQFIEDTKVLYNNGKIIIPASIRHGAVSWYRHFLQHSGTCVLKRQ